MVSSGFFLPLNFFVARFMVQGRRQAVISGFNHQVEEMCIPLRYFAAYSGSSLPTFRGNLSFPSSRKGIITISCIITQKSADVRRRLRILLSAFEFGVLKHSSMLRLFMNCNIRKQAWILNYSQNDKFCNFLLLLSKDFKYYRRYTWYRNVLQYVNWDHINIICSCQRSKFPPFSSLT